jgi:hypothetical protein
MTILRSGATQKYSTNWGSAFGEKSKSSTAKSKTASKKKSTKSKAKKKKSTKS